ncbi:MAG: hypothetical protein A2X86_02070 [Bdellovibrionales bacterium GWA2_49_15]|nr:MAG: hypothetical protein A2X86_02070 [Bdellovibrionales bacterium GWA2_49_15]
MTNLILILILNIALAYGGGGQSEEAGGCLDCHGQKGESLRFQDGSRKEVFVNPEEWAQSVHGGILTCTDCHRDISDVPHGPKKIPDARDYTLQQSNTCQRCHYAYFTRMLDGIHYEVLKSGVREAPTCVDCHGSHNIKSPKTLRAALNGRCGSCHNQVFETYKKSVHGKLFMAGNNEDVPVCTDCHGAHAIENPNKSKFHLNSYQICAKCHADEDKMKRYGLNPNVLTTYLEDFHGASTKVYAAEARDPKRPIATCTDCHGIHDIVSFKGGIARQNILKACQRCHAQVPAAFTDSWLSHYRPSLDKYPAVWVVKWAYRILIPLIILGLVLHILLHLWRLGTRR